MNLQFDSMSVLTSTPSSSTSHSGTIDFQQITSFDYSHVKAMYV